MTLFGAKALILDPPDERQARERRSAKISKNVIFWIDVFSWEYCNLTSFLVLSLESRANPAFRFLWGLLGAPGTILELSWVSWGSLGGL